VEWQFRQVVDCSAVPFNGLADRFSHRYAALDGSASGFPEVRLLSERAGIACLRKKVEEVRAAWLPRGFQYELNNAHMLVYYVLQRIE
jgi:hypothetical protein